MLRGVERGQRHLPASYIVAGGRALEVMRVSAFVAPDLTRHRGEGDRADRVRTGRLRTGEQVPGTFGRRKPEIEREGNL